MKCSEYQNGIVEAPVEVGKIRKLYNVFSKIYFLAAPLEKKPRLRGIELAQIKPKDKVIEIAVGIGHSFLEILKRVDRDNMTYGIDISPAMLAKTRELAIKNGYKNIRLIEGDARYLPFQDETFDVLYNSYMLDLMPLADFAVILKEFHRVLTHDGRLVLVNLSKKHSSPVLYERLYQISPYFWGGCRPVLMRPYVEQAGYKDVAREFIGGLISSEIVTGRK